ncbi:MAG: hypothetical protein WCT43_02370 [Candidatus Magasanikbacteria bacterium]
MGKKKATSAIDPLKARLREKLAKNFSSHDFKIRQMPDTSVAGSDGTVSWNDEFGITIGENDTESEIINDWLTEYISLKIKYPIRIIAQFEGQGKRVFWFKRVQIGRLIKMKS